MTIPELQKLIRPVCVDQPVNRLDLFGSRARSRGESGNDYDFAVELDDVAPADYADSFFLLLHSLEDLLQSPVDLLTYNSLEKPHLKEKILKERICLYER